MKAAILNAYGDPLTIEEVEIDAPEPREVLVRTVAASVCHSDVTVADLYTVFPVPMVMGHESAGIIEAVGSQVTYVQPGDHVVTCLSLFCGQCEWCVSGRPSLCQHHGVTREAASPARISRRGAPVHQMSEIGSFAEQLLVHENAVVKIDPAMPLDRAAMLGCGVTTGLGSVFNTAEVKPLSTVAVIGCGGVGLSIVQGARLAGALHIVAIDRVASKLAAASGFGATETIDASAGDFVEAMRELFPEGVDHVFEAVGRKDTVEDGTRLLKMGGTLTIVGMIRHLTFDIRGADIALERRIQTTMMGSNRFRVDIPRYVELYLQGRLRLDELVTSRIALTDVNAAFDALRSGEGLRQVMTFEGAAQ